MSDIIKIRRALISVYNKENLVKLAEVLRKYEIEILSTGGTLATLKKAGVQAVSVSTFTGAPEILGGRVKTLHPKVHAGILFRRGNEADEAEMKHQEYKPIDMVVVNLYPFEETVANPQSTDSHIIENIDIGGPTMIRAAAKNFDGVAVVTNPSSYDRLIDELEKNEGGLSLEFRRELAGLAFENTYKYDTAIARYFKSGKKEVEVEEPFVDELPEKLNFSFIKKSPMRYGENPHQKAAFYEAPEYNGPTLARAEILAGKSLSYNNISDLDAVLDMLLDFDEPFACVFKHANPCGAAIGKTIGEAYQAAHDSDPLSAFGSIIGLNRNVDLEAAERLHKTHFVECIIAPSYDADALDLMIKKKARRILALPEIAKRRPVGEFVTKYVRGGVLYQTADDIQVTKTSLTSPTVRKASPEEIQSLLFAWKVVKHTKSNAIVIVKDTATVGIGMGQTSRVDSSALAVKRAGKRAKGAVLASDAFFPMPDGVEVALEAGVKAIIQPGGSKGDPDVIEAVDKAGASMVFTGIRHFKH
ncbi:MAG: bifunctional phosphoribosylaminoimidazolecarboxamide formyltransferase/IMP cyclohydrolase [Candidatus Zixiibacteriota bacterium]